MSVFVDPDMAPILARTRAAPFIDYENLPRAEGHRIFEANSAYWAGEVAGVSSRDLHYETPEGPRAARIYTPENAAPGALIVRVHGGGWTFGSIQSHDKGARMLASHSGVAVVGVDYRLAPEHPSPAGVNDVIAAITAARAGAFGEAPQRIALEGDSAGANLALGALIKMRDEGMPALACAALCYGCFGPVFDTPSHRDYGDGSYGLSTQRMRWYWKNHLGGAPPNPVSAPLDAPDLSGLPPLYLNAASLDPLHDDTILIAPRLAAAGVPVTLEIIPGVVHGFLQMTRELPAALRAVRSMARFLSENLKA